jgi:hypothetical protein
MNIYISGNLSKPIGVNQQTTKNISIDLKSLGNLAKFDNNGKRLDGLPLAGIPDEELNYFLATGGI